MQRHATWPDVSFISTIYKARDAPRDVTCQPFNQSGTGCRRARVYSCLLSTAKLNKMIKPVLSNYKRLPRGVGVSIYGSHPQDQGSIPCSGDNFVEICILPVVRHLSYVHLHIIIIPCCWSSLPQSGTIHPKNRMPSGNARYLLLFIIIYVACSIIWPWIGVYYTSRTYVTLINAKRIHFTL